MKHPEESYVDWLRDVQKGVTDRTAGLGLQINTWLVVGNAGALALAFNAVVQGSTCSLSTMQGAAGNFATGLALAFSAAIVSYAGSVHAALFITTLAGLATKLYVAKFHELDLAKTGADTSAFEADYEAAGAQITEIKRWPIFIAPAISITLSVASAVAFGMGMLQPVSQSPAAFATCAAKSLKSAAELGVTPSKPVERQSNQ